MQTIVKEGPIKYLNKSPHGSQWIDTYLKFYSDGTLEYKLDNEWHKCQLSPYDKAHTSYVTNYVEMFEITGLHTMSFAASTLQEADQWMTAINFAMLEKNLGQVHPHPLTTISVNTYQSDTPCSGCKANFHYHEEFICEFCPSFRLCFRCNVLFNGLRRTTVQPLQHSHKLTKLPRAKNEGGQPVYLSRDYNGGFNCDKCNITKGGPLYHCGTCGNYDECEDCCAGYTQTTEQKIMPNLSSYVADHLSANGSLNRVGHSYQLGPEPKLCPQQSSIRSELPWDLTGIENEPVPKAYFEVTFHKFSEQSQVCIGIANEIFTPTKMLGGQQNSFGYFNNGKVSQNETNSYNNIMPSFNSGDTIGAGILFDSFQQRRLFFTKNGQMIGVFPDRVHKGMDCFPGVSFTSQSEAWFTVNYDGPFMFDTNTLLNYRNDQTTYIARLPDEIVANCLAFVVQNPAQVLEMRLVSKKFAQQALGNEIWHGLFMKAWPLQNAKLKAKSWYKMYKARRAQVPVFQFSAIPSHPIENCDFEFQCPILWENLSAKTAESNENERFCDKCQKTVYSVQDAATLHDYAAKGRCVSFVQPYVVPVPMMGMPVQHHFVPPPFQQGPPPIGGPNWLPPGFNPYA